MSMCLATKFGGAAMSITALAQVVPADPAEAGVELYQKYGIVGLLIAVVVALWIDGKREASKAEARRAARDDKDDARHESLLNALGTVKTSIDTNAARCEATRALAQDALKRDAK